MYNVEDVLLQVEFRSRECLGSRGVSFTPASFRAVMMACTSSVQCISSICLGMSVLTGSVKERVETSKVIVS